MDSVLEMYSVVDNVTNTSMYLPHVHWGYYQTLIWSLLAMLWVRS